MKTYSYVLMCNRLRSLLNYRVSSLIFLRKTNTCIALLLLHNGKSIARLVVEAQRRLKKKLRPSSCWQKESKILSIQFVKDKFKVDTDNDNLSDAICIGHYAINHFEIEGEALHVKEKRIKSL